MVIILDTLVLVGLSSVHTISGSAWRLTTVHTIFESAWRLSTVHKISESAWRLSTVHTISDTDWRLSTAHSTPSPGVAASICYRHSAKRTTVSVLCNCGTGDSLGIGAGTDRPATCPAAVDLGQADCSSSLIIVSTCRNSSVATWRTCSLATLRHPVAIRVARSNDLGSLVCAVRLSYYHVTALICDIQDVIVDVRSQ